jgi:hypothetical protein
MCCSRAATKGSQTRDIEAAKAMARELKEEDQ